jgi:hypothetical protein
VSAARRFISAARRLRSSMCTDDCGALGIGLGGGDTSDEFVPR